MSSLSLSLLQTDYSPVTDPELHIRGRPVIQTLREGVGTGLKKNFFGSSGLILV